MNEDFKKVIKIFDKNNKKENTQVQKDKDGIFYVRSLKDENGNFFNPQSLKEFLNETEYIIRVMRVEEGLTCVYKYIVPAERLVSFISGYSDENDKEKIIEITKHHTNNLA